MPDESTLIVLSPFLAMIRETGELIPSFAGGDDGGGAPPPIEEKPVVPEMTPEERNYYAKQSEAADLQMQLARDNKAREEALLPALYKSYGLQMVKNPDGSYSATEAPKTPDQLQSEEIRSKANARTLAALEGKLPIDPAVEADMNREKVEQDDSLARRGVRAGSGDIYTRARNKLNQSQGVVRDQIRTGQMTTADALSRGRTADMLAQSGQKLSAVNTGRAGTGQTADLLAGGSSLYGAAASPYLAGRFKDADYISNARFKNNENAWNEHMMDAQGSQSLISGGMQAGGSIIGAALLACWIAEVLYGRGSTQTLLLRFWLNTLGERSHSIALGMVCYRRYGRKVAAWLQRHTWWQPPVRWVFDRLVRRACMEFMAKGAR